MDSSHDAPAPSRSERGDLSDDSLRDVIDQIQSIACEMAPLARRARELIQRNQHDNIQAGRRLFGLLANLADAHSALSNELTQTPTNHSKRRMDVDGEAGKWGAGGAVGPNETDNNAQQGRAVPADDGGAKKRRCVDIGPAADGGGHSGGGPVGAGGAGAESQQQQGGASSLSADLTAPRSIQHTHQQQQQHPVWYVLAHRGSDFPLRDVLQLRKTCKWARGLFGAPQLRQLLSQWTTDDELSAEAGLRRAANGQQLLTFDDRQMGEGDLLAALCVAEAGGWSEMSEAVELAGQCGRCQLPVRLTAGDLHQYPNKTAYLAAPRMLAQLKMVGPHIHFGDGVTFQLFQHGDTLRAVKDEDGFEIDIDPPLPPNHPYQQHRQPHDPPVRSCITYWPSTGWVSLGARDYSSVSSFVKSIVLGHFEGTHQINSTGRIINRELRYNNNVPVSVHTTESAVSGVGAFNDRFPVTTRLARAVLGAIISARIFDQ
ncbi:unnamed protein product [Vitrella brassicaformis CCMP3155]|uniref:Uncharacterized protein n=1 Tax=Vitrella brassicaformis (strain CCMP3155) TaxID=1169540 RepID=A0A0G4GNB1_VITBC|nr:unnamed protein product [Vitrella brassicaformis CCMP3155]|eukprot:CEM31675.1 unnamed protein product [Vitrella brassicaformis CCMP3155]